MRRFGKRLGRLILVLGLACAGAWYLGPREAGGVVPVFDASVLGDDLDGYLAAREGRFADITPGVEKRIVWAGDKGVKTPLSVVYIHGFSATSEEIRPVPDLVARALGANLHFTRLSGHGRGGAALAGPGVSDWLADLAEALAIGRALGDEVLVIATSTGGTLAAIAAQDPAMSARVKGIAFISPAFGTQNRQAVLLTWPFARSWVPFVAGDTRSWEPLNAAHGRYWTTSYPTVATLPYAAAVKQAVGLDFSRATMPALFLYSEADKVVTGAKTTEIAQRWGGPVDRIQVEPGDGIDPYVHVIAGDILSPAGTAPAVARILDWAGGL